MIRFIFCRFSNQSIERIYYLGVDLADWVSVYEAEGVPPEVVLGREEVQAVLLGAPVRLGPVPLNN